MKDFRLNSKVKLLNNKYIYVIHWIFIDKKFVSLFREGSLDHVIDATLTGMYKSFTQIHPESERYNLYA